GGWRSGGWGWGFAPGFALGLGLGAAPYYAYGGPYYGAYAYGDCVMRRRAVINRWVIAHGDGRASVTEHLDRLKP
ncbi:MAG: hypothetical protein WBQ54_21680, partial [Pseudolabrys sp.]